MRRETQQIGSRATRSYCVSLRHEKRKRQSPLANLSVGISSTWSARANGRLNRTLFHLKITLNPDMNSLFPFPKFAVLFLLPRTRKTDKPLIGRRKSRILADKSPLKTANIPCKMPRARRDPFAPDCQHSHSVPPDI